MRELEGRQDGEGRVEVTERVVLLEVREAREWVDGLAVGRPLAREADLERLCQRKQSVRVVPDDRVMMGTASVRTTARLTATPIARRLRTATTSCLSDVRILGNRVVAELLTVGRVALVPRPRGGRRCDGGLQRAGFLHQRGVDGHGLAVVAIGRATRDQHVAHQSRVAEQLVN